MIHTWEKWSVNTTTTYSLAWGGDYVENWEAKNSYGEVWTAYIFNNKSGKFDKCGTVTVSWTNKDYQGKIAYLCGKYKLVRTFSYSGMHPTCGKIMTITFSDSKVSSKSTYKKGTTQYKDVTSKVNDTYPTNDKSGNYWYVYKGVQ